MTTPARPILRYHGGKWILASWIISHFPPHRVYVEPFGGAASVLLRKPRAYAEIYNDLDGEIVNLFRVVRDRGEELSRLLYLTPFAREEYRLSFAETEDPLDQARRTVLRSLAGFGSDAHNRNACTGFRANSNRSGTTPAHDWANFPAALQDIIERLRGVVIENREALEVMAQHDGVDTLHYVDPPYVSSTRVGFRSDNRHGYIHEMTDDQHRELCIFLRGLRGTVVVSGYANPIYYELFGDWQRIERPALADGARPRLETLWLSPNITANQPSFDLAQVTTS